MTNQETLTKAIQKAIGGGFYISSPWHVDGACNVVEVIDPQDDPPFNTEVRTYGVIIFDHEFAKALWGKIEPHPLAFTPVWQYHLQQMVIAEEPIKYLGEHLDG